MRQVWAEVDLAAIAHNLQQIKAIIPAETKIMAVVKANAYGHGAVKVVQKIKDMGIDYLAVATLSEALQLEREQINIPIFILGNTPIEDYGVVVSENITQTIYSYEQAKSISIIAGALQKRAKVHLKIDTGMTRIGLLENEHTVELIKSIFKLPNLEIEGIFSHLANSDAVDKEYSQMQLSRFLKLCSTLGKDGLKFKYKHIANSGGIADLPECHLDMVRPGIILYGLYPSPDVKKDVLKLIPALTLKSRIINLQEVPAETSISYGCTYKTKRVSKIATLPLGYADGYSRLLSNKAYVLVHGQKAPIVGRICMDQCMIDVSDIENVSLGDEVIHIGKQGENEIKAEDLAEIMGTINYEILTTISYRVPRIYPVK